MNFYTLFTRTEDFHLIKDVGMLPEALAENFPDVHTYIATYKNGEYPRIGKDIKKTELLFIKHKYGKILDGILFLKANVKNIDVLNIYHLNLSSYFYCRAAHLFSKSVKIYLKIDLDGKEIKKLRKKDLAAKIKKKTIKMADIVTGESSVLVNILKKETDPKICYLKNGCYYPELEKAHAEDKKNRIITVGRLGTEQKNTELLLEAFAQAVLSGNTGISPAYSSWQLRLIGSCEAGFEERLENYFAKYPGLKENIVLTGPVTDRKKLAQEFAEAKIFALPSRWESFGFVLTEAIKAGNYVISSEYVPSAQDIIRDESMGCIVYTQEADSHAACVAGESTGHNVVCNHKNNSDLAAEGSHNNPEHMTDSTHGNNDVYSQFKKEIKANETNLWAGALVRAMNMDCNWDEMCQKGFDYIEAEYSWDNTARDLYELIK